MIAVDPRLTPYDYVLPEGRIALHPPKLRDGGRLLVDTPDGWSDRAVVDLVDLLNTGDVLVVNDTRVLEARLFGRRASGGHVEILLLEGKGTDVPAMVRPGRKLKDGEVIQVVRADNSVEEGATATMGERQADGRRIVHLSVDARDLMATSGQVPLPPYIDRTTVDADRQRYQTIFAREPGAVAAPTAGLHLTEHLSANLRAKGVEVAPITLHVGPGTFRNLRSEDLDRGTLHTESFLVPDSTAEAIATARGAGGRVVAVGTTVTRTLESAVLPDGRVRPGPGETGLFIRPGHGFRVVDALMTNFHLPRTSLLMLVCAFGGRERVLTGYRHAIAGAYRFYSYGDAMFLGSRREVP